INADTEGNFRKFLLENFSGKKIDLDYVINTFYLKNLTIHDLARISGRSPVGVKESFPGGTASPPLPGSGIKSWSMPTSSLKTN
ncbi:MAG: hypothetical protein LRY55_03790, partial [Leadbetterella sp.]|nr:hypothetical protein [Leadbetterella sp.]